MFEQLSRDGYCFRGTSILEPDEIAELRNPMESKIDDSAMQEDQPGDHRPRSLAMKIFAYDRYFHDLIVRNWSLLLPRPCWAISVA